MDGFYLGNNIINPNIVMINYDLYKKREKNLFVSGQPGTGRNFYYKQQMVIAVLENSIVENHLNNNNWLKQRGRPIIRKGHKLYKLTKRLKKEKPTKIVVIDPEEEYKELHNLLKEKRDSNPFSLNGVE